MVSSTTASSRRRDVKSCRASVAVIKVTDKRAKQVLSECVVDITTCRAIYRHDGEYRWKNIEATKRVTRSETSEGMNTVAAERQ